VKIPTDLFSFYRILSFSFSFFLVVSVDFFLLSFYHVFLSSSVFIDLLTILLFISLLPYFLPSLFLSFAVSFFPCPLFRVCYVADYGLDDRAIGVRFPAGARIFPLSSVSRPALGPTQPPVQWVPGALSPGVKRGRGVMLTTHPI
jgi:hypothetical protein